MATESSAPSPARPQQGSLFAAPDRSTPAAPQASTVPAAPVVPYGELIERRDGREARISAARLRAGRMAGKDEEVRVALERVDEGQFEVEALEEIMNTRRVVWLNAAADRIAPFDESQAALWRRNAAKSMTELSARIEDLAALDRMADGIILDHQRKKQVAPPITTEPPVTRAVLIAEVPALVDAAPDLLDAMAAKMDEGRKVLNAAGFNLFGPVWADSRYKESRVHADTMNPLHMAEAWSTWKILLEAGDRPVKADRVEYFWNMLKSALDGSDPIPCIATVDTRASDARIELGKDGEAEILGRFGAADTITAHAGDCRAFLPRTVAKAPADKKVKCIAVALRKAERDLANRVQKYEQLRAQGLVAITNYDIVETFQGSASDALESRLLMLQTGIRESRSRSRALGLEVDAGGLFAGDASVGLGDNVARSLAEAERLAARRGEYSVADTSDGKQYDGRVTDLTPYHAIQSIGPKSVIHLKTSLSGGAVLLGTRITVCYAGGRGTVASPAHNTTREQQRGGLA